MVGTGIIGTSSSTSPTT